MKKRIWELDVIRGANLILMMAIHFVFDITVLFPLVRWSLPQWYNWVVRLCGVVFVLVSGVCATFGKNPIRRGLTVLGGGMIITAVTAGLWAFGLCDSSIIIYFGVLHCLGCCMLLWPLFRKKPGWYLILLGIALRTLGQFLDTVTLEAIWLIPLGVVPRGFSSSDYFPLVMHLGIFLMGAGAARYLYPNKVSLLPKVREDHILIRSFGWLGRHSLIIYLLHQPVLAALAALIYFL